jgi:hypothetical protein
MKTLVHIVIGLQIGIAAALLFKAASKPHKKG